MSKVLGIILAGGEGSRLMPLTSSRTKPAVPFAGSYRLIDFALNNFINSDLFRVYVLTQFKSQSLSSHMKRGWKLSSITGHFIDTIPAQMRDGKRWYEGTADAIFQNIRFIEQQDPEHVCIFGSDHIYKMDIRQMLCFHKENKAKLTVSAIRMPIQEATQFGVIEIDEHNRMIGFEEKPSFPKPIPGQPDWALVSMGNYIFETDTLCQELRCDATNMDSSHDFGKDIIPKLFPRGDVYVYDFATNIIAGETSGNYWRDVGTIDSYWQSQMDLLGKKPKFSLYNKNWQLHTYYPPLPPANFIDVDSNLVEIKNSMISGGSHIQGSKINKSILGYNTNIGRGSFVNESIILGNVKIGEGCIINRAVIDNNVEIAAGTVIGENLELDRQRFTVSDGGIVVISKGSKVGPHSIF